MGTFISRLSHRRGRNREYRDLTAYARARVKRILIHNGYLSIKSAIMASSIVRVPIQTEISFIGKVWIKPPLLTTPRAAVTEHFDSPEGNWNSFRHRLLRIAHSSLPPCLPIFRDFAIYRRHLKILNRRDLKLAAKKKIHSAHVVELFGVRLAPRFFALASVFFRTFAALSHGKLDECKFPSITIDAQKCAPRNTFVVCQSCETDFKNRNANNYSFRGRW